MTLLGSPGSAPVRTASGDIRCDTVAEFEADSASGDVRVTTVTGNATASTVSGDTRSRAPPAG